MCSPHNSFTILSPFITNSFYVLPIMNIRGMSKMSLKSCKVCLRICRKVWNILIVVSCCAMINLNCFCEKVTDRILWSTLEWSDYLTQITSDQMQRNWIKRSWLYQPHMLLSIIPFDTGVSEQSLCNLYYLLDFLVILKHSLQNY